MPTKSIAQSLIAQNLPEIEHSTGPNHYLILYKFMECPSPRFYNVFEQLSRYTKIDKVQKGVIQADKITDAYLVISLITRYNGSCRLYMVGEVSIDEAIEKYGSINMKGM